MRVLHIGKYFPPFFGGMETFLHDLALALARRGIEVDVLVHDHAHRHGLRGERLGEGQRVRLYRAGTLGEVLFNPISPEFPFVLGRLIRGRRPQAIHIHLPNSAAFWLLLSPSAWRIPWVVHWHADVAFERPGPLLRAAVAIYRLLEGLVLRRAARILATSPPYLEHSPALRRWRAKCEVIPLGLDPARITADRLLPVPWRDGRLRVLAVGRLTFYKGFEYLIRAAAQVPEVQLIHIGEGDLRGVAATAGGRAGPGGPGVPAGTPG
jgi:glycosyltransferase involved in cell wall biosynthesis